MKQPRSGRPGAGGGLGTASRASSSEPAERLWELFRGTLGQPPEGIWSAPGRVNLIGEYLDCCGGTVLPFAISERTWVAASSRPDRTVTLRSAQLPGVERIELGELAPGRPSGWAGYPAGVLWALEEAGQPIGGLDIMVDGRVPIGAGLSSSAALECAVGLAARDLYRLQLSAADLATVAQRAENEFVGMPCGLMDQMVSMLASPGHLLAFDTAAVRSRPVPFDPQAAGLVLLIIDTGSQRQLAGSAYAQRRASCDEAARRLGLHWLTQGAASDLERLDNAVLLRRVRHVLSEAERVRCTLTSLAAGDLREVARLMSASHTSLRDDFEVSAEGLDMAVVAAMAAGAWGARMTGAGFGGCAIALAPADLAGRVAAAVRGAFEGAHLLPPRIWPAQPSAGACRDR